MRPENLESRHIASSMKISVAEVLRIAENPRIAFCHPKMRPVGAKMRLITAPKRKLRMSYQWLATFLRKEFPPHPAAHGSVPGRSPFTAGRRHLGLSHLLSRDIKNAFPNVTSDRFYLQLLALGFSRDISALLTKLLLPDGYIPQGSPTSNAAIDLYFYRADAQIERRLSAEGARYTRFTDNLDTSFPEFGTVHAVSSILHDELTKLGLSINRAKEAESGWQPRGREQVMCGVRVDSTRGTQLPSKTLADLLGSTEALYHGALSVAPHTICGLARKRRSVQGWLNQASQADLAPVRHIRNRLRQADLAVRNRLHRSGIFPRCEWYVKSDRIDIAAELAADWCKRWRTASPAA